jgi:hypothetical protein
MFRRLGDMCRDRESSGRAKTPARASSTAAIGLVFFQRVSGALMYSTLACQSEAASPSYS